MAGINLSFIADVRSLLTGTRDVNRALDTVSDALDDMANDGDQAARELERDMRQSFDDIRRDARRKTDDIADDTKRNMRKAGEATGDFKREAVQNVSETASSWDGSMEGIADMVQGTFGGLADLPGIGLAVAGIGAAGGAAAALWQQHTEAIKQNVSDMFDDLIESGEEYLSQQYIQEAYWKIIQAADGAILKQSELNKIMEATGLSREQVALAYAGDQEAIIRLQEVLNGKLQEQNDIITDAQNYSLAQRAEAGERQGELNRMIEGLEDYRDRIDETVTTTERARQAWDIYEDSQAKTTQNAIDRMRDLGTAINGVPRSVPVDVDLTRAEQSLRTWRPVITATFRAGQAVV